MDIAGLAHHVTDCQIEVTCRYCSFQAAHVIRAFLRHAIPELPLLSSQKVMKQRLIRAVLQWRRLVILTSALPGRLPVLRSSLVPKI